MDIDFIYAPVIKGKLNDIKALSLLGRDLHGRFKPMFELPPFLPTDTPEKILARFSIRLSKYYANEPCYIDFPLLKPGARISSGESVLACAFGQLTSMNVNFEPVYGFDRDERLWPVVLNQAAKSGGMLLRLDKDDVEFEDETLDRIVDLVDKSLDTRKLDVMLDFRYLNSVSESLENVETATAFLEKLHSTVRVRKILVAGSSALKTVTTIGKDSHGTVERRELALWTRLRARRSTPGEIIYSDYGVIHPDFTDLTPSPHINGKIRYTQGTAIHVFRGHSLHQGNGFAQYRDLSQSVIDSGIYQGNTYSHGDRYIYDCATGYSSTGNAGTWVLNDQNHHVTYALNQIAGFERMLGRGMPAEEVLSQA